MKTIRQALVDEISYPLRGNKIENKLIARSLEGDEPINAEIINSKSFLGAVADCLFDLIDAPNFSESDISISLQDRDLILKKANYLYKTIGEEEKTIDQPNVYVGPPPGTYASY